MKLPSNVYKKFNAYYYVMAVGKKRKWTRLSSCGDGLPALYAALAELHKNTLQKDGMKDLINDWMLNVMIKHAPKTQIDEVRICRNLAHSFSEFKACEVQAPDILEALAPFKGKSRTYNMYRAMMRELMRYSIEKGYRLDNPVEHIKTIPTPARDRYITDSELRRIKIHAIYGNDGLKTRSGLMICGLIDMAYLTGQRIGDLLGLTWSQFKKDGIEFQTNKTGAKILIQWTPKLLNVKARLLDLKNDRNSLSDYIFITQDGKPYTYSGASTAWKRAVKRSGVKNVTFHDIRAKALTDMDLQGGIIAAQKMGGHTTQQQTKDYIRNKSATKISATR